MRNDVEFGPLYVHLHNDILLGKSLINDELSKIDKVDVNFFTVPDIQQAAGWVVAWLGDCKRCLLVVKISAGIDENDFSRPQLCIQGHVIFQFGKDLWAWLETIGLSRQLRAKQGCWAYPSTYIQKNSFTAE